MFYNFKIYLYYFEKCFFSASIKYNLNNISIMLISHNDCVVSYLVLDINNVRKYNILLSSQNISKNWSTKVNIFSSKIVPNTSIYVD